MNHGEKNRNVMENELRKSSMVKARDHVNTALSEIGITVCRQLSTEELKAAIKLRS